MVKKTTNKKIKQDNASKNYEPIIIDFGQRQVYKANFSRAIILPKIALTNIGIDTGSVSVQLVQDAGEKYIKVSSAKESGEVKQ